jgi:2-octaprenyl-6-methoxyphenol hydroxylase
MTVRPDPTTPAATEVSDVAVVGAGPVGLSAAILFSALGFSTALIAPERRGEDPRTTALLGGSLDFYRALGLDGAIRSAGAELKAMRLVDATDRLIRAPETLFSAGEIGRDSFGINIANADLVAALEAAAGDGPRRHVAGVVPPYDLGDAAAALRLDDGTRLAARLVVAADGRDSPARRAAGIAVRAWSHPQAALVCDLRHARPHDGVSTEFHGPTGPFVLVPLPGGNRSSVVLIDTPATIERLVGLDDDAFAAEVERRARSILGAMAPISPRRAFPLSSFVATRFARDRIALVGEAAHAFPPIGAQGLNLSLRDVAHLAEVAVAARDAREDIGGPAAMRDYERRRRLDVETRARGVDLFNRTLLSELAPAQALRAAGLGLAGALPAFGRLLMRRGLGPSLGLPRLMRGLGLGRLGGTDQGNDREVGNRSWVTR